VTTYYVGKHYEIINGVPTKYIFAGNQRVAKVSTAGTFYYHGDHLGSAAAMTDANGAIVNVVETTNYAPYGSIREHTGQTISNYKFTDQELDPETGLYYYGARYYDPTMGRFISPDSIVQNSHDPQTLNRYSYCRNNPLIYLDPNGHVFLVDDLIIAVVMGAIIGGGMSGALSGGDSFAVMKAALIGAVSGAVGYGVGGAILSTTAGKVAAGALGGMAAGGVGAALSGGNIGQGMLIGGVTGSIAGLIGSSEGDATKQGSTGYSKMEDIFEKAQAGLTVQQPPIRLASDSSLFAGPGADPYNFYTGGVWSGPGCFEADLGQSVKIYVKNVNVLGTTVGLDEIKPIWNSQESHLLPQQERVFRFAYFSDEPVHWNFCVRTYSSAFSVTYQIWSTWVPGMPVAH
jgi:RHS repeat-associated protein